MDLSQLTENTVICGPAFSESIRILSAKAIGNRVQIEGVGVSSQTYYNVILNQSELAALTVSQSQRLSFTGDAEGLFLYVEAIRIRNAYQFDPLYGISVSQIDPLPHQIEAVYHYMLKNPRIRFLLADDPGAGKTIMAGLLLKELKYRGLVERTLIVVPGHLKDQWTREMKERFQETFLPIDRAVMEAHWGQNVWVEKNQLITSIDFIKQEDVLPALEEASWDLVIVDEAHKMSAYRYGDKIDKTERYRVGEILSRNSQNLLFLTATPHRGDPENFRLFLDLLQPGLFAKQEMLEQSIQNQDNPLFLRRLKEDLKNFDGTPLFPPRHVQTVKYRLSEGEKRLYNEVTTYVKYHYNKALSSQKRNVAFALAILQRRMASSIRAIRCSLERRQKRLTELYNLGAEFRQAMENVSLDEESLENAEEVEQWKQEEELLEKLTAAETLEELKAEIDQVERLASLAKCLEQSEAETKLSELRKVIEETEAISRSNTKLLIFTEARETMEYLADKLSSWGFQVTTIHGGMNMEARIQAEHEFRNSAQIMVATEAAGEGINLQFCWLMVNYDIPWNPNRLEQRMGRIHRYGQRNTVRIYNLVAADTLEGRILSVLFDKLDQMRAQLGDRVFDVIGDVLLGASLKELILEAISNQRTLDEIVADMDRIPNAESIRKAREATLEALATRHIDFTRILGEQRLARENRLVPEYLEQFFLKASRRLGLHIEKRRDGCWNVPSVPWELRNVPVSFQNRYGKVGNDYRRITFDKDKAFREQAEFITMGHPLMETVVETVLKNHEPDANAGAVFYDPEAKMDGILWILLGEVLDGNRRVAGQRLICLYQPTAGDVQVVPSSILWDLKPAVVAEQDALSGLALPDLQNSALDKALDELDRYKQELQAHRKHQAEIKRRYGLSSLDAMILESDAKLTDYETRRLYGQHIPEATIQNERRHREDLVQKKRRLEEEIRIETNLYPSTPKVLAVVRVLPMPQIGQEMRSDADIEQVGMQVAMAFERQQGRCPEDVSAQCLGYDVRSTDAATGAVRYIEVKARAQTGAVALTPNEWVMAQRFGDEYWLYVVENAAIRPILYTLQNPAAKLQPEEEIEIVRYIVTDWRKYAEKI